MKNKSIFFTILAILFLINKSFSQEVVTFSTNDNVQISAYDYNLNDSIPYVILLHNATGSKMDYLDIAYKIVKLGYNCLAIDMRVGNNETSSEYKNTHTEPDLLDARKDIKAAINFAYNKTKKTVILFGTEFSASLALIEAKSNPKVKAVIAFSPGEYFTSLKVEDSLAGFSKPAFVACSQMEYPYIIQLLSKADTKNIIIFKPGTAPGDHGLKALDPKTPGSKEYWLNLYLFFKKM
jgi:alpha-beta hydrolase superfamily lysophospholipase